MSHAVLFYRDDAHLIDGLVALIRAGDKESATVIVIVTEPHREQLLTRFQTLDQVEIGAAVMYIDAMELLSSFMVNGQLDQRRFVSALSPFVQLTTLIGPTRIFGEMVAVLWAQGNTRAALCLEELWTELGARYAFSRICVYPQSGFPDQNHETFHQVCQTHTRVLFDQAS